MIVKISPSNSFSYEFNAVAGSLDFSGFPSYVDRQPYIEAFNNGDYVVIPDPVPTPPQPDWDGFMVECNDVFAAGLQVNYLVFTQVFNMLLALKAKGGLDEASFEWRNFAFNYQIGKAALSPEQIAQVEGAMQANNIPVIS